MNNRTNYLKFHKDYVRDVLDAKITKLPKDNCEEYLVKIEMEMKITVGPELDENGGMITGPIPRPLSELQAEEIVMDHVPYVNATTWGKFNYMIESQPGTISIQSFKKHDKANIQAKYGKKQTPMF